MVSCLMFVQGPENLTQQTSRLLSVKVYKKAGMHRVGQCKKGKEGFFCPESGKPVLQDGSRNQCLKTWRGSGGGKKFPSDHLVAPEKLALL